MTMNELRMQMASQSNLVIAIEGPSGAGKSTLAELWKDEFDCTIIHTDDYFLPNSLRTQERLNEPGGFLDHKRILDEVFSHIHDDVITSHHFNCMSQELERKPPQPRRPLLIIEGVYSMHPLFQQYYDYTVFLDVDQDTQYHRILSRSDETMLSRYITEWIPKEERYFQTFDIKNQADVVFQLQQK